MEAVLELLVAFALPLGLTLVGFVAGTVVEHRHYRDIRRRERELLSMPVATFRTVPPEWEVTGCGLVAGNVVISVDYFKWAVLSLKSLLGGTLTGYESLLDRARREAVLRLKTAARESGYTVLMNVRLGTSAIAEKRRSGAAGVEVFAVATGLTARLRE